MLRHFGESLRAMCIRHPIDRLYSDLLHTREVGGKFAAEISFKDWVREGCPVISTTLYVEQLSQGDLARLAADRRDAGGLRKPGRRSTKAGWRKSQKR